ncbi:MAG: 3'-5' exonuclease [Victivallaceae bacterium]|nr:3'-5' exonuclease [Victivallaceae bacterium]
MTTAEKFPDGIASWLDLGPFTVFDVETTGMSAVSGRIVEIAAMRIERDGSRERFSTLVNPQMPIPWGVRQIHHISDEMVADAPVFARIGQRFLDFAEGSTLAAHNARFDLSFLQESLHRSALPLWRGRTLDTLKLIRKSYPSLPSHKLQYLREAFRIDELLAGGGQCNTAHRAGDDVEVTVEILRIALESFLKDPLRQRTGSR